MVLCTSSSDEDHTPNLLDFVKEATFKPEANGDIESQGQDIEPTFPLNISTKHLRVKRLPRVAGWAVLNNLLKSNAWMKTSQANVEIIDIAITLKNPHDGQTAARANIMCRPKLFWSKCQF